MKRVSSRCRPAVLVAALYLLTLPLTSLAMIIASGQRDVVLAADLSQDAGDLVCDVDMDGRIGTDFVIRLTWLTWNDGDDFRYDVRFESTGSGAFIASDSGHVAQLEEGTSINTSSQFRTCGEDGGTMVWYYSDDDASNCAGEWGHPGFSDVTTTGYIGVRVPPIAGGFDQFGWIRITVKWIGDSGFSEPRLMVTVHEWATDIADRSPIDAGRGPDYEDWATRHFSESLPVEHKARDADPDGDGLVNLAEYAFLRQPEESDHADPVLTVTREAGGQPVLDYRRRSNDPVIAVVVDVSSDLNTWMSASNEDFEEHIYARIGNVSESVRATVVGDTGEQLFFRLSVVDVPSPGNPNTALSRIETPPSSQ